MSLLKSITEGGQLATHSVRMFKQVIKTSFYLGFLLWFSLFAYHMRDVQSIYLQSIWYHGQAHLYQLLHINTINIRQEFWSKLRGGKSSELPVTTVIQATKPYTERFYHVIKQRLKRSLLFTAVPLSVLLSFFFLRGRQSGKKHHIRGNKLSLAWLVAWKLKLTFRASKISIGSLPLIKGTETQHILITGGTGSGKTNCLHHLLTSIRGRGQRAIIVDTTGILTNFYYREGKDIILNPLDERGAPWHPWIECQDVTSYDAMAASFIPRAFSDEDEFWRNSARIAFSAILEQLEGCQQNSLLVKRLFIDSAKELCESVQGTPAAPLFDINAEKMAGSIRGVLASYLNCIRYLPNTDNPFSIREWVHQDQAEDQWLFINCTTNQREALNPLLSTWFSISVRSLLELSPDFNRRLWFVVDELPTLNYLRNLDSLLTESRKYGGCAVLALQSLQQLEKIYGRAITQVFIGNCSTKFVFSEQNPIEAGRIAEVFGDQEVKEYQRSLSYGANDIRDGVNLNQQLRHQPLITKTDIQFLPRNHAFVRLPDNYPIVKLEMPIFKQRR